MCVANRVAWPVVTGRDEKHTILVKAAKGHKALWIEKRAWRDSIKMD